MTDSTTTRADGETIGDESSPFVVYRSSLDTYRRAIDAGLDDAAYVELVTELDRTLVPVDGTGFRTTPLLPLDGVVPAETIWAKVETDNVGGSHKARHLFGLLLQIAIDEHEEPSGGDRPLAIASCGNAAMGAAVIARAVERELLVFVPTDANPVVLSELHRLGADVRVCERRPGQLGDPCLSELDLALGAGARPFTVQGPICPGVIDGGRTLGLELAHQLVDASVEPADLYIQIGGGALATAVVDGLQRAEVLGRLPRLHPVQPATAHPYVAAWQRLRSVLAETLGIDPVPRSDRTLAESLAGPANDGAFSALIASSDDAMTPWPGQPSSIAGGILDDVTYDWKTVLRHQLQTGGWPVLASEEDFIRAERLAGDALGSIDAAMAPPDHTGAAGLAGLLADTERRNPRTQAIDGPAVVVLSGRRREGAS
ncbi:MAG: PLP-dependent lyase/thiolase [Acidimicrobiales bacterium]